jgi:hypothetical protein
MTVIRIKCKRSVMAKKTAGIDRRDFLKTAAVGASAAAFPVGGAVATGGGEAGSKNPSAGESAVRGKPIPPEKEGMVHLAGFMALMALMVFVMFNDISRLFG